MFSVLNAKKLAFSTFDSSAFSANFGLGKFQTNYCFSILTIHFLFYFFYFQKEF